MKKISLLFSLLLGLAGVAHAQHPFSVGIKAGNSITGLVGSDVTGGIYKSTCYHFGLMADLGLTENLALHPEVLYSLNKYDSNTDSEARSRDIRYLAVPVLLRYYTAAGHGLFFEAGPQVSIPLKATDEEAENVTSEFHKASFEYAAGLGYQLNGGFSVGVRYNGGITDIYKKGGQYDLPARQSNAKNSVFLISLGYAFGHRG